MSDSGNNAPFAERVPSRIKQAVSEPTGGGLALVIGAGCSVEPPTGLPLSAQLAADVHRRLIEDGILPDGDCDDPSDLSCVADAVDARRGSQADLVQRLPRARLRSAEPNEGSLIAAALMRERALRYVLTLNFDLGMSNALSSIGAGDEVAQLQGPEDYSLLGLINLVYLHRNVNSPAEEWVLRTEQLEESWREGWERVMAQLVLGTPVSVFVGLGTPARVLIETTQLIRNALGGAVDVFQADVVPRDESAFAEALGIDADHFIDLGWSDFMRVLADRVVQEHRAAFDDACRRVAAEEGWEEGEDAVRLCEHIAELGLIGAGQLRARWALSGSRYEPAHAVDPRLFAPLILVLALIGRVTESRIEFDEDGGVELWQADRRVGILMLGTALGTRRWAAMEEAMLQTPAMRRRPSRRAVAAIAAGVIGSRHPLAPPDSIVAKEPETILTGARPRVLSVDEVRERPDLIEAVLSK